MSSDKAAWLAENLLGAHFDDKVRMWTWTSGHDTDGFLSASDRFNTGNGMLEIIEAMRVRGYDLQINHNAPSPRTLARFWKAGTKPHRDTRGIWADSLPAAVIEAAYAALLPEEG